MTTATHDWPLSGSTTAASNPPKKAARDARIPIARVEHFMLSELTAAEHEKLVDDTYRISLAYFPDDDRAGFEKEFLSGDKVWMFLFYGPDGTLAGFAAVGCLWVKHGGKDHAVFKGVVCVDAAYKLTWRARLPVIREAALFKLFHPWTTAGYMGMAASPSGYRVLTSSMPCVYPSRHEAMPEHIKGLVLKASRLRGHEPVDEERLLVASTSRLADADRIRGSRALKDDPDARFYVEKNPDFERFYLLCWVPLDLKSLARGAVQAVRRQLLGGAPAQA